MAGRLVEPPHIVIMLEHSLTRGKFPDRDNLMILLSFYCGLRSAEVAALRFEDVVDVEGFVGRRLYVREGAKYGKKRDLELPDRVAGPLRAYIERYSIVRGPLFMNQFGDPLSANAYQRQFGRIARECGFQGVSSHSGRRTLITSLARAVGRGVASLRDVQHLAGHSNLTSTQAYIEQCEISGTMIEKAIEGRLADNAEGSGNSKGARGAEVEEALHERLARLRRMKRRPKR